MRRTSWKLPPIRNPDYLPFKENQKSVTATTRARCHVTIRELGGKSGAVRVRRLIPPIQGGGRGLRRLDLRMEHPHRICQRSPVNTFGFQMEVLLYPLDNCFSANDFQWIQVRLRK
ncbi:hypothetical protein CDAR_588341 [Caerostris darwini]|uniref:Uncharacterized protein n=1 Tax=Caerostris darwini TaxID=1538125 RepID=A0AAV4S8D2_9ARAC|nr:hypothetical protein CDAR_588341 [Caerostris darwini]